MTVVRLYNLTLGLDDDPARALPRVAAERLQVPLARLGPLKLVKRGYDLRERVPRVNCTADVELLGVEDLDDLLKRLGDNGRLAPETPPLILPGEHASRGRVIVVGSGPAGGFAAYVLALHGLRPLLIERGKPALQRLQRIGLFNARRVELDPEDNALFGEGGAGSFSDGKLWTHNRDPFIPRVLETFVQCGAPERILVDSSPHVGTDILARVVVRMRERIVELGGEVRFGAKLTDVEVRDGALVSATINAERVECGALMLAIGHSARDTYAMLHARGVALQAKPFQLGVRIEHPQEFIDQAQLAGRHARDKRLTPAAYDLSCHVPGAPELFSFCMCPGGITIAAVSEPGCLNTNGMSFSVRASGHANSALVTTFEPAEFGDALAGIELQRRYERAAFAAGGGDYTCPAQPVTHFLRGIVSPRPLRGTYARGRAYKPLEQLLPEKLVRALRAGLPVFEQRIHGFIQDHAILHAVEARASGPVRIVRDRETRQSTTVAGLYPCGEGAGYAGGIVSAACDGIHSAHALLRALARV